MPNAPLAFCATSGCAQRVPRGHCAAHSRVKDQARGTASQRGYTARWSRYSQQRLALHPWCVGYPDGVHPERTVADVTDHIQGAARRPDLFWEPTNHQSLCRDCNSRKAIAEEGGFQR